MLQVDQDLHFSLDLTFREYLARVASRLPPLPWALCDACANVYELARFSHHNLRRAHFRKAKTLFTRLAEEIRRAHALADSPHAKHGPAAGPGDAVRQQPVDAGGKGQRRRAPQEGEGAEEEKGGTAGGEGFAARARAAIGALQRMRRPTRVDNSLQRVRNTSE